MYWEITEKEDLEKFDFSGTDNNLISVVGLGAVGAGAVNYMKECGLTGVEYYLFNINQTSFEIMQTLENMKNRLYFHRLVFIVGDANEVLESGLFQKIGSLVNDFDSVSFGVLTIPLSFDKMVNRSQIIENFGVLQKSVTKMLLISIEHLLCSSGEVSLAEADQKTYHQIMLTVKTFKSIYLGHNVVSIDLADLSSLSHNGGFGIVTSAVASGENKCLVALDMALYAFPKMEIIGKAKKFLLYIAYSFEPYGVTIKEVVDLMDYFNNKIDDSTDLIWSTGPDSELLDDNVRVTIIAAGLDVSAII
jgi:cell division protein FtsZ